MARVHTDPEPDDRQVAELDQGTAFLAAIAQAAAVRDRAGQEELELGIAVEVRYGPPGEGEWEFDHWFEEPFKVKVEELRQQVREGNAPDVSMPSQGYLLSAAAKAGGDAARGRARTSDIMEP